MHVRVETKFFNSMLINAHSPTEDKEDHIKDQFFYELEIAYDSVSLNYFKIILGDLNAKVGKEQENEGTIELHSLHEQSNNNGERLTYFAMSKNMIISSTIFPHKHVAYIKEPGLHQTGTTFNQIDHVLIGRRFAISILDKCLLYQEFH